MIFPKYIRIKEHCYNQGEPGIHHNTDFCLWNSAANPECRIFRVWAWDLRVPYDDDHYAYMSLLPHKYGKPETRDRPGDVGWYALQKVLDLLEEKG